MWLADIWLADLRLWGFCEFPADDEDDALEFARSVAEVWYQGLSGGRKPKLVYALRKKA